MMGGHHKKLAAIILAAPKGLEDDSGEEYDESGLESAAEELVSAIHEKDAKAVAGALRAAFEICEASPHEELEAEG